MSFTLNKKLIFASLLLLINVADQSPLYISTFDFYRAKPVLSSLSSERAKSELSSFSSIYFVPVFDLQKDRSTTEQSELLWRNGTSFYEVLLISSNLNLRSNFAYQSRSVGTVVDLENAKLFARLNSGQIENGELFVFKSLDESEMFKKKIGEKAVYFSYDSNYFVGLPN
jgi:hypothetical protein